MFQIHPHGDPHSIQHYIDRLASLWNAFTNTDETEYWTITRPSQLESLLQLEAFQLHDGCTSISEAQFEREREVVRNENRQRYGTPEGQVWRILASHLFPAGHPYARTVAGDDAQISALTLADACDFMQRYYAPERATLIVAGGVELAPAVASIEKWFGGLAAKHAAPRRSIPPIALTHERQTIDLDIERPMVAVSWALPPVETVADDHARREYFRRLDGVSRDGSVWEFSTRVGTMVVGGRAAPVLTVLIELDDLSKVDQALDFVWKEASSGTSVTAHPADEARRIQTELVLGLESLQSRVDHIADLVQLTRGNDFIAHGPLLFRELDTVKAQDLRAIDAVVHQELDPDRAHITVFRPNRNGIKGDSRATFEFQPPEELAEPDDADATDATSALDIATDRGSLDGATRYQLDNGMHVVLLPNRSTLPVVTAKLMFDSGDASTPDNPLLAEAMTRFATPAPGYANRLRRARHPHRVRDHARQHDVHGSLDQHLPARGDRGARAEVQRSGDRPALDRDVAA